MTLAELTAETLMQKHKRLMRAKCPHEEVCSSTVSSSRGESTNSFCFDCGKTWRYVIPATTGRQT